MRILSGHWAGQDLTSPGGRVRPTSEVLRGLWMDHLEPRLDESGVLDLYAGSGALGLEALSRGAESCDFVENGPGALHALKTNVARFRLKDRARVFRRDARLFATSLDMDRYDICLADPPFSSRLGRRLAEQWLLRPFCRILAIEHPTASEMPETSPDVSTERLEHDGATVTIYVRSDP